MNHIEIRHLRMMRTIAETGNMTKAAEILCISQSALSQQLKDIEGKLKVDLFFRTRKKMILTPIGKKLLKTAQYVLAEIEDTELEIGRITSGDRGEIKVGTQCMFCYNWLPRIMLIYQQKFPNIEIEIGDSEAPFEELQEKKYDIIITAAVVKEDNFTYAPLFEDQMVCIMPKDHALSTRPWVRLEDFERFNLISHADKAFSRFYQVMLKPNGIEPKGFMTIGQPHAIIEMVAAGFGMSVIPMWAVQSSLAANSMVALPITDTGLPVEWQAVFLKKNRIPIVQQEFISIIKNMNIESRPGPTDMERDEN